ncbi:protein SOSEKI 3-like [Bidens hawaiensis]|uniref:protein SOSEKI 3-like n=1 Tax=Bidens hawaiensis TaxID=980011 RepID=UPI0040498648
MEMEIIRQQKCRKVPVLYYLCRNRQLEHPHFIEVPIVSPDGLYLRDVIERFDSLRGRGMASMYSWSCKRSYKNAFVWNDLGKDDLIVPANENEYVLKGSELVEHHNSGRFVPATETKPQSVKQLSESPSSITQDEYSSSTNIISQEDDGCHSVTKYKIYKSTHGLADASTQTDEHVKVQETCITRLVTDNVLVDSPPSSSDTCSSGCKDTLESLMKADKHHFKASKNLEEQQKEDNVNDNDNEDQVPTNTNKIRTLLRLISCGSVLSQDHNFSQTLACRTKSLDSRLSGLTENPRFIGMNSEDKQYFSGSLVETNLFKKDESRDLKRSFSYSANRINMFDSTLTRTKCIPRSIMGSLGKHSRSSSRRFCEDSNSCILSPCISSNGSNRVTGACLDNTPSNRMESFGDNKENVIKIEESFLQERELLFTWKVINHVS